MMRRSSNLLLLVLTLVGSPRCAPTGGPDSSSAPETTSTLPASAALTSAPTSGREASASAATDGAADDTIVVNDAAVKLGAPAFRVTGIRGHGWSRPDPDEGGLLRLSGPPGGPLGFDVRVYAPDTDGTLEAAFKKAKPGLTPLTAGPEETVKLAGADRKAQSFRTGQSFATANWCVIHVPGAGEGKGLLVLADIGSNEQAAPRCALTLERAPIKPLVESFTLLP